jgi:hypothetical protein
MTKKNANANAAIGCRAGLRLTSADDQQNKQGRETDHRQEKGPYLSWEGAKRQGRSLSAANVSDGIG